MSRSRFAVSIAIVVVCSASALNAQSPVDGRWEGAVEVPNKPFGLVIDLAKRNGQMIGTFTAATSDTKGLPLADVSVEGTTVRFLIKAGGGGSFKGSLSSDANAISGEFTTADGTHTLPFSLKKTGAPQIETIVASPAIGAALVGTWNGTLTVDGTAKRLVLTLSNQADNTSSGTIGNADEGLEIPITTIAQQAASVILGIKTVGGNYTGTLNADGTEIAGTWTQGSLVLPLTFKRVAKR